MDILTKSLMFEKRRNRSRNAHISVAHGVRFGVISNKNKISGNYKRAIHDIIQGYKILIYWNKQGRFLVEQNTNIDWDVVKLARGLLWFDRRVWMVKQVSGFFGTSVNMQKWKFKASDECPLCNKVEDNCPIMKCKSNEANSRWLISIEKLENHLLDNDNPTDTVNMIIIQLNRWLENTHEVHTNTSSTLSATILAHNLIGW